MLLTICLLTLALICQKQFLIQVNHGVRIIASHFANCEVDLIIAIVKV